MPPVRPSFGLTMLLMLLMLWLGLGCGKANVDQALESDARGYFCPKCQAKFYTAQAVFADVCPQCGSGEILDVMGAVCASDGIRTLAPRARGSIACQKCGKPAPAVFLPRESDLKQWGALSRSKADVSGKR